MVGVEQRPDGEQFADWSASDQAFAVGSSVDLVGNLRALVDQERERQGENFNAAWWLGNNLKSMENHAYYDSVRVLLSLQERERQGEKHDFLWGLRVAWYLRAYQEVDGENNYYVFRDIQSYSDAYETSSVTLPP